jgi:hypothetical protein
MKISSSKSRTRKIFLIKLMNSSLENVNLLVELIIENSFNKWITRWLTEQLNETF